MTNDKQIKIGIISHYYKNNNYGGMLQAYALCRKMNDLGYDAMQISYAMQNSRFAYCGALMKAAVCMLQFIKHCLSSFPHFIVQSKIDKRLRSLDNFRKNIPHTKKVYDIKNITDCNDFNVYITGSDQVWNPSWVDDAFLLNFVQNKIKISYAASLGVGVIDDKASERYKTALADYSAISVRETNAVGLLQGITNKPIELVLDPTLLLTADEWSEICEGDFPKEDYVFCYFLGGQEDERCLAKEYAKGKGYKLLSIPYLNGSYRKTDAKFNCEKVYDVSVGRFINLIRHAKCVFTDSFHASVFSHIFHKEFFTICRGNSETNGSGRLYTLTEIFDTKERVLDTDKKKSLQYITDLPLIDYSKKIEKYNRLKDTSIKFLKNIETIVKNAEKK